MAAATEDRNFSTRDGKVIDIPVKASTVIYAGTLVCDDGSGYAQPAEDTAGLRVLGFAEGMADNSGSLVDGAISVRVRVGQGIWLDNDALTIADRGKAVYAEDDQTVAAAGNVRAGILMDVDASKGALVLVDGVANDDISIADDLTVGGDAAVTGSVTATGGFVGDVTGDVTGDLTGDSAGVHTGNLLATAGTDLTVTLADAAGAQGILFKNSPPGATVAGVNSLGAGTFTALTATGLVSGGQISGAYGESDTNGVPGQAVLAAALGAGSDGELALYVDTHGGAIQPYLCGFSTTGGGWWVLAMGSLPA